MKKEEYLTEERYHNSKKKIQKLSLIILIIGFFLGALLIIIGITKLNDSQKDSDNTNLTEVSIVELQSQVDNLENELITLKAQKNKEFTSNGFSEEYYRLDKIIGDKNAVIMKLESQIWKIESGYNETVNDSNRIGSTIKSMPYFIFGGFIIIATCMISGSIYLITKRREMLAFGIQQVMPVAQEGIEKMTPTLTKVGKEMAPMYGDIAKEISKGIKKGLKDERSKK